jgi:hypothetical protein
MAVKIEMMIVVILASAMPLASAQTGPLRI